MDTDDLVDKFHNFRIDEDWEETWVAQKNSYFLSDLLQAANNTFLWQTSNFNKEIYKLIELENHTSEYARVKYLFSSSMKRSYTVSKIKRVENPYLLIQYTLKKLKKRCSEKELFHGTSESNIDSICRENFNWRMTGTSVGHRFGQGISFSPDSTYSSFYPRNYTCGERVMFVADVLIKSTCEGNLHMTIPTGSADTSIKPDGKVVVKYEDNDFYHKYIIYYS